MTAKSQYLPFFVALLALSGTAVCEHSQKTFLAPRPHGVNTAMEYTTWYEHAYSHQSKSIHSHFQITPFYQNSQQHENLGRYFGIGNGKNSFTIGKSLVNATPGTADVEKSFLIHDITNASAQNLRGTITFNPEQEVYGSRLDFFQCINTPIKGLFVRASMPFVHVANDLGMTVSNASPSASFAGTQFSVQDFFAGRVSVTATDDAKNIQNPLTKAKIDGRRTAGGIADIDIALGYKYLEEEMRHVFVAFELTIPTGKKVRGDYLFDAMYGNGRHVGVGASIDAGMDVWSGEHAHLRILWTTRYKYLFQSSEQRTPGIQTHSTNALTNTNLAHYFLGGIPNQAGNSPLFPAANVITLPLAVKPGSMFDTSVIAAVNCSNFSMDIGYNIFWRDRESIHNNSKNFSATSFAVAQPNYDTSTAMNSTNSIPLGTNNLDLTTVTTPSLLTHKVFAGIGYNGMLYKKYHWSTGVGAHYEFATSNADIENYGFWIKFNVSV